MIIPYCDDYEPFVVSSWTKGLLSAHRWPASSDLAMAAVRALVADVMRRSRAAVMVNDADPRHALGWVCWDGPLLHWIYVKNGPLIRGIGCGTELWRYAGSPVEATCKTAKLNPDTRCWKRWGLVYNPGGLRNER